MALEDQGHKMDPDFAGLLRARSLTVIATQGWEGNIGTAANARQVKGSTKYWRPERAMSRVLSKRVLDTRHRFAPLSLGRAHAEP